MVEKGLGEEEKGVAEGGGLAFQLTKCGISVTCTAQLHSVL